VKTNVPFDDNIHCDRCGRFGVFLFESEKLCAECYGSCGSCCTEFPGNLPKEDATAERGE
jgi:hypothetical protein